MENPTEFEKGSSESIKGDWKGSITIQEQIAYITRFYPTPKFVEMTFEDTSASSNQSDHSQDSIADSSSSSEEQFTVRQQSPKGKHQIGCNGLSEIKAENFGFDFNGKKFKQNGKRSAFETQFDYEQLIGELSFHDNIQEKVLFSAQKNVQRMDDFELEEKDKSFTSYKKKKEGYSDLDQRNKKGKLKLPEKKVPQRSLKQQFSQNTKWDPPSQVRFRKQNRLKWIANMLSIIETTSLQDGFNRIWYHSTRIVTIKCNRPMRNKKVSLVDSSYMSKDPSMIENDSIIEKTIGQRN